MRWKSELLVRASIATLLFAGGLGAQESTGRVSGVILDAAGGTPLSSVTVTIVGTRLGVSSGTDGRYSLRGVPTGTQHVRATRIGYEPQDVTVQVTAGGDVTADITMKATVVTLQTQVVVGYGVQRRADVTGAVASVTPNAAEVPTQSIEQVLRGKVPGVDVTQASNEPGGGISVRIRGGSSITGNNEPLYVIDGFPVENDIEGASAGSANRINTVPFNPLNSINPADVESVDILKDASATAIYGARGANGVIIITTRRGSGTKPRFTLDTYVGTQSVAKKLNLLNGEEFAQFVNEWAANQTPVIAAPYAQSQIDSMGAGTDWQAAIFRNAAPVRSVQLGVSGGTAGVNSTRYTLSGGLYDQQGVVRTSQFRRASVRGGLDQLVGSKFHVSSNLMLSRVATTAIPTNGGSNQSAGAIGAALQYYPTIPIRNSDGSYALLQNNGPAALAPSNVPNPVSLVDDVIDKLGDTRVLSNLYGEYTFMPGLVLRVSGGADYSSRFRDTYYPRTTLYGVGVDGQAIRGRNESLGLLNENTLNYQHGFGRWGNLNSVVGYTRQKQSTTRENMLNSNYVSDLTNFEDFGAGARPNGPDVTTGRADWTFVSYLGRLNYTFQDKYLFTVTGRRDGSSRFGEGKKWGFFPSAAFGWWASEEPFFKRFTTTTTLKLRASWGIAGNPSIRPYQSLTHLAAQQYAFGGVAQTGYYPSVLGNPNLSWESTEERDYGLDLGLFDGRIELTADVYNKHTRDLLLAKTLPLDAGFATVLVNTGSVKNTGEEAGLTAHLFGGQGTSETFHWSSTLNYASNRNKVLDLGGDTLIFAARAAEDLAINGSVIKIGEPLGVFYGYKTYGILRTPQEAADYTASVAPPSGTAWSAGDMAIVDINGDKKITVADRAVIGSPLPDFTIGWTNDFGWKRFDLSTTLEGSYGAQLYNLNLNRLESGSPRTNLLRDRWTDRWTPENSNAKYPRIGGSILNIGADMTSDMLEDGSYTRLRQVTLGYTLPPGVIARGGITSARVYLTGTNLVTWTKYGGYNPDVSSISVSNVNRGIDIGAYPLARTWTVGFNLSY